jgi:hypothetical protein
LVFSALIGCEAPQKPTTLTPSVKAKYADESPKVLKVNNETFTRNEIRQRLTQLHPYPRHQILNSRKPDSFLDTVANFEVLADIAERRQLDQKLSTYMSAKRNLALETLARSLDENQRLPDYIFLDLPEANSRLRAAISRARMESKKAALMRDLKKNANIDINKPVLDEISK